MIQVPIIGWVIAAIRAIGVSVPFYFLWRWLAPVYLPFLPEQWQALPFWHCVGLFGLAACLRVASPFVVSSSSESSSKTEKQAGGRP